MGVPNPGRCYEIGRIMYIAGKKINRIAVGGEEDLNGLKSNEIRIIDKFKYDGRKTEYLVLNNKAVVVIHNNYQRIILPFSYLEYFSAELKALADLGK